MYKTCIFFSWFPPFNYEWSSSYKWMVGQWNSYIKKKNGTDIVYTCVKKWYQWAQDQKLRNFAKIFSDLIFLVSSVLLLLLSFKDDTEFLHIDYSPNRNAHGCVRTAQGEVLLAGGWVESNTNLQTLTQTPGEKRCQSKSMPTRTHFFCGTGDQFFLNPWLKIFGKGNRTEDMKSWKQLLGGKIMSHGFYLAVTIPSNALPSLKK